MQPFNWHKEAKKEWNQRASSWHERSKQMWDHGSRKNIIPFFTEHVDQGSKVLDVGCGDGYSSYKLNASGYDVDGIDLSNEMVQFAKQRVQNNEINFRQANVNNLPYEAESFDALLAINVLEWTEVPAHALQELSRVLKKDGFLCVGILGPTAGPRRHGYPQVYGEKTICNSMMPWEFEQLARENGYTYFDGFGVHKKGVTKNNLHGLSVQLKQALSFMWVFMLKKEGENDA